MGNKVAIIGAGASGLAAAERCRAYGFETVVFESQPGIGGLWNSKTGGTWSGLKTNISTLTSVFPDFPWPEHSSEFPTQPEMFQYLNNYADKYQIKQYIRFNCPVKSLEANGSQWQINSTAFGTECYDYVIIASGIFSKPYMPVDSSNNVIHSSEYKTLQQAAGKNVIVYGGGFSGVDIAAAIADHAQSVTHVIRSPHWIIPRYIGEQLQPLDKVFYNQPNRANPEECLLKTEAENKKINSYMASLAITQTLDPSSPLYINPTSPYPAKVAISDTYLNLVASGKISVKAYPYESNDCDLKIYCTGYQVDLNYMHPDILEALQFDSKDQLQPILLHKCTWHPCLPNMAFVGMYRGPYFQIMYRQAEWASLVFSKKLSLPDKAIMHNSLLQEKATRDLPKALRPQFPHGDYVGLRNDLTKIVSAPRHGLLHGYNLRNQRLGLLKAVASAATYGIKQQVSNYVNKLRNF